MSQKESSYLKKYRRRSQRDEETLYSSFSCTRSTLLKPVSICDLWLKGFQRALPWKDQNASRTRGLNPRDVFLPRLIILSAKRPIGPVEVMEWICLAALLMSIFFFLTILFPSASFVSQRMNTLTFGWGLRSEDRHWRATNKLCS